MEKITEAGMVVGMHAGLDAPENEVIFNQEKNNVESVYGEVVQKNRQHYLLFDINKTPQVWQNSNILHDSTLVYAEREGFRCGTCHEYFLFDFKNDRRSTVKEHPPIVMDTMLFHYRKLDIENALTNIERLNRHCQRVGGDLVIIWHNDKVFREYEQRFKDVYCKFLERNS